MATNRVYEVIVVGAGVEGSATARHLVTTGTKNVLLLEQFDTLHTRGSSHGGSRITRRAYNQSFYVHMMSEAFELWDKIEKESGTQLYWKSGIACIGKKESPDVQLYIDSMNANGVANDRLSAQELNDRYPRQFNVPSSSECVFEKDGGVLKATKAVRILQESFVRHGGELLDGHRVTGILPGSLVTGILPGSLVTVQTEKGDFRANRLILTMGAWTNSLLKNIGLSLSYKVFRAEVLYFKVSDPEAFSPENFPAFLTIHGPVTLSPGIYSTPVLEYPGLIKVCQFYGTDLEIDPEERDVFPHCLTLGTVSEFIRTHLKGVSLEPSLFEICLYAETPDNNPFMDRHPSYPNIVIGAGFSHGFKMSPVIGKILSELAQGLPASYDLSHFKINRFNVHKSVL